MNSRLFSIIRKEFIQIRRDPRTLVIVLIIPILQLFLLGYAATNDVRNVPLAIYDQSNSPESRALLDAYRSADYFKVAFAVTSETEMRQMVESGQAKAGLIIPPGYARQLKEGTAQVAFVLDGSDPTVASTSLSAAQLIGQRLGTNILADKLSRSGQGSALHVPVEIRTTVWFNPDLASAYFMIPGVIGMVLSALTAMLTATAVVRERERGTIEQLIVTPIRSWELIVGKLVPYTLLSLFNMFEVLALGHWWFGVPILGSLGLVVLVSTIFLISGLGIGLFASTIANTQQEAMLTVWMTLLPSIFLSGFFFPISAMPSALQLISHFIPLRYYLVLIRAMMIKGVVLWSEVFSLVIFAVAIMSAATLRFKKRLD
jgi:ABC-2 type transport system permease protein